ncbi:restriction endonuclease subunit S [Candidatus Saccharibacteria bacterium oral taxon 488]|nr:restriction endonuclease subunit S [Candidatus Saccharibacteria bacterium oral taxon 488]
MMQIVSLSDAITLQRGFDLPTSQRRQGKYPVVASTGTTTTHDKFKVKGPGVVIGRSGSIGGGQYVESDFWPLNTTLWVKDFKGNDEKFIYYTLKSLDFSSFNVGAAVPTLNRNHLSALKVRIPDVDKQKKIANILGSLDEKIELNRRMNETLEQLGQALFRHYFVDNPEAKSWDKKPLDEIANFLNGLAMQKYPKINGQRTLPVIKIREMSSGITDSTDIASANIPEEYIVHDGDLLFSWSGTLMVKFWSGGDGALNQHLFKVTSDKYPEWLYYYWTKYYLDQFISIAKSKATTMGHIQRKHLKQAEVIIPPNIEEMTSEFTSIIDQIKTNLFEINSLVNIRSSLLPKLISGEIEI